MSIWSQPHVKTILKYLWIFSALLIVWQVYSSYSSLPERLATHFDSSGNPNGWSSRRGFLIIWCSTILGMNAMWLLSVFLIPRLLRKKLAWTVNIPNKDYWLATDERIQECSRLMNAMMFGIAFLINVMMAVIYHIIVQSNVKTTIRTGMWGIFATTGIMLLFTFVYLFTAFRKPKEE